MKQAELINKLDNLQSSSSQSRHIVPAVKSFLAENQFVNFTATENSSTLNVSLDVINAQGDRNECFLIHNDEKDGELSNNGEKSQDIEEEHRLLNRSVHQRNFFEKSAAIM